MQVSDQASVKIDADIMREKLSQITETRNQLRGKAIALAQEVRLVSGVHEAKEQYVYVYSFIHLTPLACTGGRFA